MSRESFHDEERERREQRQFHRRMTKAEVYDAMTPRPLFAPRPITGRQLREENEAEHGVAFPHENDVVPHPPVLAEDGMLTGTMAEVAAMLDAKSVPTEDRSMYVVAAEGETLDDALDRVFGQGEHHMAELADLHRAGAKDDGEKLDYTLVPVELEDSVCAVMTMGAKKYTRNGWRTVPDGGQRYLAAMERHVKAFKDGEDLDPESGLHHLAHAACNLGFLLHFAANGIDIGAWRGDQ